MHSIGLQERARGQAVLARDPQAAAAATEFRPICSCHLIPTMTFSQKDVQQPQQLLQPAACPPRAHISDPNTTIKQALAIAIVRNKRSADQEANKWRAKAQRLKAQLQEQAAGNIALRAWALSICNSSSSASTTAGALHGQQHGGFLQKSMSTKQDGWGPPVSASAGMFLPPLTLPTSGAAATGPGDGTYACNTASGLAALQDSYHALQQQLLLAAQAASICSPASSVLSGKAASLSDMLLTNMRMLLRLQQLGNSNTPNPSSASNVAAAPPALSAISGSLQDTWPTETMATLSSFITGTLLQVPGSSLQRAYMQQCAALLGALLAHLPASPSPPEQEQQMQQQQEQPCEAGRPLQQQLHKQQQASQAGAVAVQAVNLMQQLLTEKMVSNRSTTSNAVAAAAAAMLQQLSAFPSTALLLALAVAQQLQRLVQQLQQANAAASATQLGRGFSTSQLQHSSKALAVAAELFEASHGLLEELDLAVQQLPSWAVALSSCSWTVRALDDLVAMTAALYSSCQSLHQQQPLLADKLCQLAASVAMSLQHLATAADAPGMRSGAGAALRSACGSMCMRLRDLFMPTAHAAAG